MDGSQARAMPPGPPLRPLSKDAEAPSASVCVLDVAVFTFTNPPECAPRSRQRKSGGGPADAGSFNSESGVRGPLLVWYSNAPVQSRYPAPAGSAYVLWLSRRPDCHFDCLNQPLRTYHRLRILGSDHPRERQALLNFAYDLRTTCLRVCSVMAARSMPLYLSRQQRVESGHDHVPIPSWPERSKLSTGCKTPEKARIGGTHARG